MVTEDQGTWQGCAEGDPGGRLRGVVRMAQAMTGAPDVLDVARTAADHARVALGASMAAVSVWERAEGRLRVLVNHGELADGEEPLPAEEVYPVADFPQIAAFPVHPAVTDAGSGDAADHRADSRTDPGGSLPPAWIEHVDDGGPRAAGLRQRGRACCVVAPILLDGRAWGELYAARAADAPPFTSVDADYAAVLAGQVSVGLAQTERLAQVRALAFTDPLTGLANRRAVDTRLAAALERHRAESAVVSLIVCDVNGLKRLNDERGHEVGDRMLERFADQLSLVTARLPGSLAARLGGDEFCVVVEGLPADTAVGAAEEICRAALRFPEGEGVACGVASTGDPIGPVEDPARLFRLADAAQYRAKASRSAKPVVAGRGDRPDAVIRMADEAARAAGAAARGRRSAWLRPGPRGDRRRFRGAPALHTADPARLLEAVTAALDARSGPRPQPVDTIDERPARLVTVADTAARMVDAAAWTIHRLPPHKRHLELLQYSVQRRPGGGSGPPGAAEGELEASPAVADAVRGGAVTAEGTEDAGGAAVLLADGYRQVLLAGATDASGGGWLLQLLADGSSMPLGGLGPALRGLVAVALL
jgi:diguanylate cyclase (GGDEF)-like protein